MAGEDKSYCEWIRSQPCRMCGTPPRVTAHHETGSGMGLRAHDHRTIPMCGDGVRGCHGSLHNVAMKGSFYGWKKADLRVWQREQIDALRSEYIGEQMGSAEVGSEEVF